MSKKNASLLFVMALVFAVVVFAAVFATVSYAGLLPWDGSQFVAYCTGSAGGSCGVG
ncbi:MAG: hypothetical protein R6X34_08725 [Chloroflexota bacterium]